MAAASNTMAESDRFLLEVLATRPPLQAAEVVAMERWWLQQRREQESLTEFLERQGVLLSGAVRTVQMMQRGYLSFTDAGHLFAEDGLERLRSMAADAPTSGAGGEATVFDQSSWTETVRQPDTEMQAAPSIIEEAARAEASFLEHSTSPGRTGPSGPYTGRTLGAFRLLHLIGEGPHGAVYAASDIARGRRVVVKVLATELADQVEVLQRFLIESASAARISDPGIVKILSSGQDDDLVFLAMEALDGPSLQALLDDQGPLSVEEAIAVCRAVVAPLRVAHGRGLVHGNLKPSNVWPISGGVRLSDFGLPLLAVPAGRAGSGSQVSDWNGGLRADLRSLAMLLYRLITGETLPVRAEQLLASGDFSDLAKLGFHAEQVPPAVAEFLHTAWRHPVEGGLNTLDDCEAALTQLIDQLRRPPAPTQAADDADYQWEDEDSLHVQPQPGAKLEVGSILGRCLLTERLGAGGTCVVFRALHRTLNIPVAVKVLQVGASQQAADVLKIFSDEARLLARLNHPNIVRVLDFEDQANPPYLVLEHVEGLSLVELIEQSGRLRPDRATQIVLQVCAGLEAAQTIGLVHRDMTPGNILLAKDGGVKIADLGLAVLAGAEQPQVPGSRQVMGPGTPAYMSPEQASGDEGGLDHRADIYSLGCTFYHAVTGQLPFSGNTPMEVLLKHVREEAPAANRINPDVPGGLAQIIQRMMAKAPGDRFGSYAELRQALTSVDALAGRLEDPATRRSSWKTLLSRLTRSDGA